MNDDITVITADYMYLVIIANTDKLEDILCELNFRLSNNRRCKYMSICIDFPVACINYTEIYDMFREYYPDKLRSILIDKCIKFGEGVEPAQTLTFAEGYNKSYHILLEIEDTDTDIFVRFPKLNLEDETEPEKLISSWVNANNLEYVMDKLIIRPVNIVGSDNEILVFAARIPESD